MVEEVAAHFETKMEAFHVFAQWTLQCFKFWPGWAGASIDDEERAENLKLLLRLALLNKPSFDFLVHTPEFAAARLATADVVAAVAAVVYPEENNLIRRFEKNLAVFGRSWQLQIDIPPRLRLSPLGELDITDLREVRRCLKCGWVQEFNIPRGRVKTTNSTVWVTPARR